MLMSFIAVGNTSPWAFMSMVFSLTNGGTAGAIYMFLVVAIFMFFVVLVSLAVEGGHGNRSADIRDSPWQKWPAWPRRLADSIVSKQIVGQAKTAELTREKIGFPSWRRQSQPPPRITLPASDCLHLGVADIKNS